VLRCWLSGDLRGDGVQSPTEYRALRLPVRSALSVRSDPLLLALPVLFGSSMGFAGERPTSLSTVERRRF
jgi:hypothetical protein